MINLNTPEIQFALDAVRAASHLIKKVELEMVSDTLTKGDRSPVTVADYAAQALVGYLLGGAFPDDPLVGEEDSAALRAPEQQETLSRVVGFLRSSIPAANADDVCAWIDRGSAESGARYWTVDPIDGTKGFLRGMQYAVALALVENGEVRVGALGCPNLSIEYLLSEDGRAPMQQEGAEGSIVVAARGQGTWAAALDGTEFTRLHASNRAASPEARLLRSYESAHTNTGQIGELVAALGVEADPVGLDSQAKYAVLAAGRGDALVRLLNPKMPDYREKVWDQGAGSIVVEEAGGKITDLDGKTLDFARGRTLAGNRGVLASNGHLHLALLAGLREVDA